MQPKKCLVLPWSHEITEYNYVECYKCSELNKCGIIVNNEHLKYFEHFWYSSESEDAEELNDSLEIKSVNSIYSKIVFNNELKYMKKMFSIFKRLYVFLIYKHVSANEFETQNNLPKFFTGRKDRIGIRRESNCYSFRKDYFFPAESFAKYCEMKGISLRILILESDPPSYRYQFDLQHIDHITEFLDKEFYEIIFEEFKKIDYIPKKKNRCIIS